MNSSPFEIFRRNLKPLMVLLTGLALFAFVVLPVVDSYMRQNSGTGGNSVVATYDGKDLTRNRVDYFTRNHNETIGFLTKLANATIKRGGVPKTPGFQYDPRSNQVVRLGINDSPSSEVSVRTMMFAAEAQKEGFDLDENAINVWLDRFTDGTVSDSDITAMLMNSTQNRMGRPHLYEQLRSHLLADVYLKRGYAGLYTADNPSLGALMTPAEQWESFLKLNRSATVDAYGVLVNDFLDQTNENPPEALILKTYEDGKNQDPSDQSAEPAFHQRYTASFEYLVGDLQTFIDEEVAKLNEEDLRAEYDKRVAGGAFQVPDEKLQNDIESALGDEAETESEKPAEQTGETETGESEAEEKNSPESSDAPEEMPEDPVTEAPAEPEGETEPAAESDATESDAAESDAAESDAAESDAPKDDAPENDAPGEEEQGALNSNGALRLVALQQEDGAAEDEPSDSEPEPTPESEPAEDKPSEEKPADAEPAEEKSVEEEPAKKEDAGDPPAAEGDNKSDSDQKDEPPADAKPKVQSFEDVREQIANDLAFPPARERMVESAAKIFKQMQSYFTQKAINDSNIVAGQSGKEPEKPDLESLAKDLGFEFKAIGPYSRVSIADEPISTSMDAQTQFGSQGPNFTLMMYGYAMGQTVVEPKELYTPLQTTEFMSGKTYVSWKVAETEASTPTLAEAREDVIKYLRMKEAKAFAQAEAERLAELAAEQSDKSLADLIAEDKQENLKEGLGPFKWLESFGRGVTMGNVPELDAVGDNFMAAVFEGDVGEYRIAANQPERVIYIVKPTKFEPSIEELRQRFREPTNRRNISAIDPGIGSVLGEFYESIDKKAGFRDLTVTEQ